MSPSASPSISPYGGTCWGEQTPDVDEEPKSWQYWEISEGVSGTIQGDQNWGKLEVSESSPVLGSVEDSGTVNNKQFTLQLNKYGTGSGTPATYIRGNTTVFTQHAISPDWETYVGAINRAWRYVQAKLEY